jgi:putative ABC transport system permease protein
MRYLPLVWAALRRHSIESLLTFLVLTVAFTLFSAMLALRATYDHAIAVNRMDRLIVSARFCCAGLRIARRAELGRIRGVQGVGLVEGIQGYHQEPSKTVGVWEVDGETMAAFPELHLRPDDWRRMQDTRRGLLFTRTQATKWHVKVGDPFPIEATDDSRQAGDEAWPFVVLGVVDDPATEVDWRPNIYADYDYVDAAGAQGNQGLVHQFVVSIRRPDDAQSICRQIDLLYANSETPTYCVPMQMDARNRVESIITMRQMSLGIGAAGLFMILFLCANSTAESVRERMSEFAVLKTVGFGDRQVALLVFLEAALPVTVGALFGIVLAAMLSALTSRLGEGSRLTLHPASISGTVAALALGIALLVGAFSSVLPLRRLQSMQLATVLAGR